MGNSIESLTSRLTGASIAPEGVGAQKETTRVPAPDLENYTPFGRVLHELMEKRGLNQSRLARKMREGGAGKAARVTIINAMRHGTDITFPFVEKVCETLEVTPEEDRRLWLAARETKRV